MSREARVQLALLDRRRFLRLAGAAAAAGLLPTGCGGVPEALHPPPELALRFLTPRTYAVLRAAAERIVGGWGSDLLRRGAVDPGARVEAFLAGAPDLGAPLGRALLLLEFGLPPLVWKLAPFTALDGPARDRVLRELMTSRWSLARALFTGVRSMALLGFYGSDACQPVERYPGVGGAGVGDALLPAGPP